MTLRSIVALLEGSPFDQCVLRQASALARSATRLFLIRAIPEHVRVG